VLPVFAIALAGATKVLLQAVAAELTGTCPCSQVLAVMAHPVPRLSLLHLLLCLVIGSGELLLRHHWYSTVAAGSSDTKQ
jgi:hypothetical protein